MNVGWAWITTWINQGVPHILRVTEPVDLPHRDLNNPVGLRIQACGFDVHQSELVTEIDDRRGTAASEQGQGAQWSSLPME